MRKQWLVQLHGSEEHVDADAVEVTASGVLAFYQLASPMDRERTLLRALSPGLWQRGQLDSEH